MRYSHRYSRRLNEKFEDENERMKYIRDLLKRHGLKVTYIQHAMEDDDYEIDPDGYCIFIDHDLDYIKTVWGFDLSSGTIEDFYNMLKKLNKACKEFKNL